MKTCVAFTATTFIVATTFDSAMGLAKYLDELPNGSSFTQELGHPDNDSSQLTDFATAFAAAGHSWTTDFCGETFPGSTMTNGEAFGDPCCTWTEGGTPDFTVPAFTTTPGKATVCASGSTSAASTASSTAASAASSTAASTGSSATGGSTSSTAASTGSSATGRSTSSTTSGSTETDAPITVAPTTDTPTATTAAPMTNPPIASDSASGSDSSDDGFPSPGGCRVKPHHGGGKHSGGARQFRFRH